MKNKSVLLIPVDLQAQIDELASLREDNYDAAARAALRKGLKDLVGEAKVRKSIELRRAARQKSALKPTAHTGPPPARKSTRQNGLRADLPPIVESAPVLRLKPRDETMTIMHIPLPSSEKPPRIRLGTVKETKLGCICSKCQQPFEVTENERDELQRKKAETGQRPVCPDCIAKLSAPKA